MSPFEFCILGLATWRVSSLLTQEKGPFKVFLRLREWVGIQHDDAGKPFIIPEKFFAELLSCVWCCSVWVAMIWFAAWMIMGESIVLLISIPLALSGFAILMDNYSH